MRAVDCYMGKLIIKTTTLLLLLFVGTKFCDFGFVMILRVLTFAIL